MNEPTLEQIVRMAVEIYVNRDTGIGVAVQRAFKIWDEAVLQMKSREERMKEEK